MDRPAKSEVANTLLSQGSVYVHFDPRGQDVVIPRWLKVQPQVVLQFGMSLAVPIPDLRVDEEGVSGTLSFNRSPFGCFVPWGAVYAMAGDDGRGMVWPESMPAEILAEVEREAGRRAPELADELYDEDDDFGDEDDGEDDGAERARVIPLRPAQRPAAAAVAPAEPAEAAKPVKREPPVERSRRSNAARVEARVETFEDEDGGGADDALPPSEKTLPGALRGRPAKKGRELPPYLRVIK